MKNFARFAIGAAALFAPSTASPHFVLLEPMNMLVQNELGDPQKLAPCGGTSNNSGTPTNAVAEARGGDLLHIKKFVKRSFTPATIVWLWL